MPRVEAELLPGSYGVSLLLPEPVRNLLELYSLEAVWSEPQQVYMLRKRGQFGWKLWAAVPKNLSLESWITAVRGVNEHG